MSDFEGALYAGRKFSERYVEPISNTHLELVFGISYISISMRFYTTQQCEEWLRGRERLKPNEMPGVAVERINYPPEPYKFFYFAHWIATALTYRMPALLWITEWGIWPSSENWHIYYKLRHSYGDVGLLHEAPGHLFLEHESEDLASFLQIAMLNGWGGYVLTHADYVNAFFSHDEFIDFFAEPEGNLAEVRDALGNNKACSRSRIPGNTK